MKKKLLFTIFALMFAATAFTQSASDFTVDAKGVITKYTGFDTIVVIPAAIGGKNITAIGDEAFRKADITSVTIPEGVTTIGVRAFLDNKLTGITIPNSVTYIGESAFANNRITKVTIPGSVKSIDQEAFKSNTTLATIIISEGVETIKKEAFAGTKCTSVSLPSTIKTIGGNAFDTSGKPSFTLAANIIQEFTFIPAMFYNYIANDCKEGTYAFNLPLVSKKADDYEYYETRYGAVLTRYTGDSTRVRIPATIGGVAVKALYGTFGGKKLAAVQIPEGITYISGFWNNELASVTIPEGVIVIGDSAFEGNQLTSVIIPNSVNVIGSRAFNNNPKLSSVIIGSNVTLMSYDSEFSDRTRYDVFDHYTRGSGGTSLDIVYKNNNKAAGTYIKIPGRTTWVGSQFPPGFIGTWKRDNSDRTLTFTANTIKSSSSDNFNYLQSILSDNYTLVDYDAPITIKLVNGNLVISGDSIHYSEYTWNGTWKKQ